MFLLVLLWLPRRLSFLRSLLLLLLLLLMMEVVAASYDLVPGGGSNVEVKTTLSQKLVRVHLERRVGDQAGSHAHHSDCRQTMSYQLDDAIGRHIDWICPHHVSSSSFL